MQPEEQRQVAVDPFALQHFRRANAFPRRSNLDQHMLAVIDPLSVVLRNNLRACSIVARVS